MSSASINSLLNLLQISDSAFPTGSFAHSAGLEAAYQRGFLTSSEKVEQFLLASLENGPSMYLSWGKRERCGLTLKQSCLWIGFWMLRWATTLPTEQAHNRAGLWSRLPVRRTEVANWLTFRTWFMMESCWDIRLWCTASSARSWVSPKTRLLCPSSSAHSEQWWPLLCDLEPQALSRVSECSLSSSQEYQKLSTAIDGEPPIKPPMCSPWSTWCRVPTTSCSPACSTRDANKRSTIQKNINEFKPAKVHSTSKFFIHFAHTLHSLKANLDHVATRGHGLPLLLV